MRIGTNVKEKKKENDISQIENSGILLLFRRENCIIHRKTFNKMRSFLM